MGIRDTINEKFGWSRKQASLTLALRGLIGVIILIISAKKISGSFSYADDSVARMFEPIETVHSNHREAINTFILISVRVDQLLSRVFMNIMSLINFYPFIYLVIVGTLICITSYLVITKFSEDASWSAEKSNRDVN